MTEYYVQVKFSQEISHYIAVMTNEFFVSVIGSKNCFTKI